MRNLRTAPLFALMFVIVGSLPAFAGTVSFNFNTLASGADSTAIQTYMNGVLAGNATVAVSAGALRYGLLGSRCEGLASSAAHGSGERDGRDSAR